MNLLVPVEPTGEMLADGWNASAKELAGPEASGACYRAMLAAAPSPEPCTWDYVDDGDYEVWRTDCGHEFHISDGEGPAANGMNFCCACGMPLLELRTPQ